MGTAAAEIHQLLRSYEGLIFRTAQELRKPHPRFGPAVQMEQEDVEQVLRVKLWRALSSFKPERIRKRGETIADARNRYVFMCLTDQGKDLRKKKRVNDLYIEDVAPAGEMDGPSAGVQSRDRFEVRYLSSSHEQVFGGVEEAKVLIPSTLTEVECSVVVLLYAGRKQSEAARHLGIDKREMERLIRSIRLKLADWRPESDDDRPQLSLIDGCAPAREPVHARVREAA